eukprot:4882912-Prymnesium_polylepis.1
MFVPPPLEFAFQCHAQRSNNKAAVWNTETGCIYAGTCSLASAHALLTRRGYSLLQFDWPDGVWVAAEFAPLFWPLTRQTPLDIFRAGVLHAHAHYARMDAFRGARWEPCHMLLRTVEFAGKLETLQQLKHLVSASLRDRNATVLMGFTRVHEL